MKKLSNIIQEDFKLKKKGSIKKIYSCQPATYKELRAIVKKRLAEDKDADLNDIDVSNITDMSQRNEDACYGLFFKLDPHNIDISQWDMSNVEDISFMFDSCKNFNCDLSNWDVSKVHNARATFRDCRSFNGAGLEYWTPLKTEDMNSMFMGCWSLNCDLSSWDVSNVETMYLAFNECTTLKKNNLVPSWYHDKI